MSTTFLEPGVLAPGTRTSAKLVAISAAATVALFGLLSIPVKNLTTSDVQCTFAGYRQSSAVHQHVSPLLGGRTHPYSPPIRSCDRILVDSFSGPTPVGG
jgi:hypothetical protein